MRVISRKIGERIRIRDVVDITVLAIRGPKVRLGIHAAESEPAWEDRRYSSTTGVTNLDQPRIEARPRFRGLPN